MNDSTIIRKFQEKDKKGIENVCYNTGFLGNSLEEIFIDKPLFSRLLLKPYFDYEKDNIFVAENNNEIIGYMLSSTSENFPIKNKINSINVAKKLITNLIFGVYKNHKRSIEYANWLLFSSHFQRANNPNLPSRHENILNDYRKQEICKKLKEESDKNLLMKGFNSYYKCGIDTKERIEYNKKKNLKLYDKKETLKFKNEFPNEKLYHSCYIEVIKNE